MATNGLWDLVNTLLGKEGVTEIAINGPQKIFVEREGRFYLLKNEISEESIAGFVTKIAALNKSICDEQHPIMDGLMPDGSRINIVHPPFSNGSPAITIRRYLKNITSFDDNPNIFGLSAGWISFFKALVDAKSNLIISGGTGVGKTTLINLILREISPAERVVTIEDTLELNLLIPNWVRLESRSLIGNNPVQITTRDLLKNALRMRPDRIIVGEVRGKEVFDLLQAMNTGHEGSLSSVHASSTRECLSRLENLFLLAEATVPLNAIRSQICYAVDFIVQLGRTREGERVVREIAELTAMEGGNVLMNSIAKWNGHELAPTGTVPSEWAKIVGSTSHVALDFFAKRV